MTREDAIRKAYSIANMPIEDTLLKELIDEIYDEFEDRICKNCKYYFDGRCENHRVDEMIDPNSEFDYYIEVEKNFGCNRFVKKHSNK